MNHKLGWMMMDFYCGSQMLQISPDCQGDRSGVPEPAVCAALGPLGIYEAWRN